MLQSVEKKSSEKPKNLSYTELEKNQLYAFLVNNRYKKALNTLNNNGVFNNELECLVYYEKEDKEADKEINSLRSIVKYYNIKLTTMQNMAQNSFLNNFNNIKTSTIICITQFYQANHDTLEHLILPKIKAAKIMPLVFKENYLKDLPLYDALPKVHLNSSIIYETVWHIIRFLYENGKDNNKSKAYFANLPQCKHEEDIKQIDKFFNVKNEHQIALLADKISKHKKAIELEDAYSSDIIGQFLEEALNTKEPRKELANTTINQKQSENTQNRVSKIFEAIIDVVWREQRTGPAWVLVIFSVIAFVISYYFEFIKSLVLIIINKVYPSSENLDIHAEMLLSSQKDNLIQALRKKYTDTSFASIKRLLYENTFNVSNSFINLAVVEQQEQQQKEQEILSSDTRDSVFNYYERIHQPIKPFELQEIFKENDDRREIKHILIEGRAGIGKTVLCHYLANQWALVEKEQSKDWMAQFTAIIWLPLRALIDTNNYTNLSQFIYHECLLNEDKEQISFDIFINQLNSLEEKGKALYLLDGYDEIASLIDNNENLKHIIGQLLEKKLWLATSRPNIFGNYLNKVDRHLEIIGFNETNIHHYVRRFFKDYDSDEKANEVLNALDSNVNLKAIAYIPINLELICSVWKENHNDALLQHKQLTITVLYQNLTQLLARRFLQERCNINIEDMLPDEYEKHARSVQVLQFLEVLAWELTRQNDLIFKPRDYSLLISEYFPNVEERRRANEDIYKNYGLLKSTGDEKTAHIDQDYYFIHSIFTEFLAAKYLAKCLQNHKAPRGFNTIDEFFINKKYDLRYELVWIFTAGILHHNKDYKKLNFFFNRLLAEPHDLAEGYHNILIAKCYEETELSNEINEHAQLQTSIMRLSNEYLYKFSLDRKRISTLINLFKSCTHITQSLTTSWMHALNASNTPQSRMTIQRISIIAKHNTYLAKEFLVEVSKEEILSDRNNIDFLGNFILIGDAKPKIATEALIYIIGKHYNIIHANVETFCNRPYNSKLNLQILIELLKDIDRRNSSTDPESIKIISIIDLLLAIKIDQGTVTAERLTILINLLKNKSTKSTVFKLVKGIDVNHILDEERTGLVNKLNVLSGDDDLFIEASYLLSKFSACTDELINRLVTDLKNKEIANKLEIISVIQQCNISSHSNIHRLVLDAFLFLLRSEDNSLKPSTIKALGKMGKNDQKSVLALKKIMADIQEDFDTRRCTIEALAEAELYQNNILNYLIDGIITNRTTTTDDLVPYAMPTALKLAIQVKQIDTLLPQLLKGDWALYAAQILYEPYHKQDQITVIEDDGRIMRSINRNVDYDVTYISSDTLIAIAIDKTIGISYREHAIRVLTLRTITKKIINALIDLLQDENYEISCSAASALGELNAAPTDIVEALKRALNDTSDNVKRASIVALAKLSGNSIEALNVLHHLLEYPTDYNDTEISFTYMSVPIKISQFIAMKLFASGSDNPKIMNTIVDFLRLRIKLPDRIYPHNEEIRVINKIESKYVEDLIDEILKCNRTNVLQNDLLENLNDNLPNCLTIQSNAFNFFITSRLNTIFLKKYILIADPWLLKIFYTQLQKEFIPIYISDNSIYFYEQGKFSYAPISNAIKIDILNNIAIWAQKFHQAINNSALESKDIEKFDSGIRNSLIMPGVNSVIQNNNGNSQEKIISEVKIEVESCMISVDGINTVNNIYNIKQADDKDPDLNVKKSYYKRKLLSIEGVYDVSTSGAHRNQLDSFPMLFMAACQRGFSYLRKRVVDSSLPLFNTLGISTMTSLQSLPIIDTSLNASYLIDHLPLEALPSTEPKNFSADISSSSLPPLKQATFSDQLCLLHYTINQLQQSRYWPRISHYLHAVKKTFPQYRPHAFSKEEFATLQHCQQLTQVLINKINHEKTRHISKSDLFKEVFAPILNKLRQLEVTIDCLLKQPISDAQLSEVVSTVNEIQKRLESLNLKQLNKALRYAEIKQSRIEKRAEKTGQSTTVQILIEYRKHEKRMWTIRQQAKPATPIEEDHFGWDSCKLSGYKA